MSRANEKMSYGTLARVVVLSNGERLIHMKREERRGEPLMPASMPMMRLGAGYLYINVSYSGQLFYAEN